MMAAGGRGGSCEGVLITLEGIDGCGKSTQAGLLAERLEALGLEVLALRDPGGTHIGEKIRAVLLDPENTGMANECELLLYEAARAQLVCERVAPALARGAWVVCDRFSDSTFAYQAGARGLDEDLVRRCNALGACGVVPRLTLVLDLDPALALARATGGGADADRLEGEGLVFERRVREAYLRLARLEPGRVRVVDAAGTVSQVQERLMAEVRGVLGAGRGC